MSKSKKNAKKPATTKRIRFGDPLDATVAALIDLARARAKRKRVPFTLSHCHVPQLTAGRVCPITHLPFVLGVAREGSRPHPLAPSIDRIKAHLGYTPENVRLVSWWANSARNNLTDDQFAVMVEAAYRARQSSILQ